LSDTSKAPVAAPRIQQFAPPPRKPKGAPQDFDWLARWAIPEPNSGCLIWLGPLNKGGYGSVHYPGQTKMNAHRAAYLIARGPIPPKLEPDHLCRLRCCIEPNHLELVTRSVNLKRGNVGADIAAAQRIKTHCPQGHAYEGHNLYRDPRGGRGCMECRRTAAAKYAQTRTRRTRH
jgi:HNH endonuclease